MDTIEITPKPFVKKWLKEAERKTGISPEYTICALLEQECKKLLPQEKTRKQSILLKKPTPTKTEV